MNKTLLFHDGCGICRSISGTLVNPMSEGGVAFESINLGADQPRSSEALALGVSARRPT